MLTIDCSDMETSTAVRTSLSLSMLTGQAISLQRLGTKRGHISGLTRFHLALIEIARALTDATVTGTSLRSTNMTFKPGALLPGSYTFRMPLAGAVSQPLLLVLPALLATTTASRLTFEGATHVSGSPTFDDLAETLLPLLARMGGNVALELQRYGFAPAGGGRIKAEISPSRLKPLSLDTPGTDVSRQAIALVAHVVYDVAEREADAAVAQFGWPAEAAVARTVKADCSGNVVSLVIAREHVTERFSAYGEVGRTSDAVVDDAGQAARAYLASGAAVGPDLCEMLLIPMGMAGSGSLITSGLTQSARVTMALIEKFLPVEFATERVDPNRWRISLTD